VCELAFLPHTRANCPDHRRMVDLQSTLFSCLKVHDWTTSYVSFYWARAECFHTRIASTLLCIVTSSVLSPQVSCHPRCPVTPRVLSLTSFVLSLTLTNSGFHPGGRLSVSTANPWFWEVMNAWPSSRLRTGWLWPLTQSRVARIMIQQWPY